MSTENSNQENQVILSWERFLTACNWLIQKVTDTVTSLWTTEKNGFIDGIEADYQAASEALQASVFATAAGYKVGTENNVTILTTEGLQMIEVADGEVASGATAEYLPEGAVITLGGAQSYTPVTVSGDNRLLGLCDSEGNLLTTDKMRIYTESADHTDGSWSEVALEVQYGRNIIYAGGEQSASE